MQWSRLMHRCVKQQTPIVSRCLCCTGGCHLHNSTPINASTTCCCCCPLLQDIPQAIGRLGLQLHQRYPSAVPSSFVWGFGRPLWDQSVRELGRKPLRIMVLGPAASGKSMQCGMLAER
jgi:hypothetical protein